MSERSLREERREQRRALSRDQILDVAEQVFARKGYHDSSLREIAELAEYSVGAVYGFFSGKEELYLAIFQRRRADFVTGMSQIITADRSPAEKLLTIAEWQIEFFRTHPEFGRLVLRGGSIATPVADPVEGSHIFDDFRRSLDVQADLFRRGQHDGVLRDGDPQLLARMFSGLVSAFQAAELARPEPGPLPVSVLLEAVEAAFITRPVTGRA